MLKTVLFAAVVTPAVAGAQVIEVTVDRSVVDLSVPGGNEVMVSVTIDRQGYAEGPWADFEGWVFLDGYVVGTGGHLQLPTESTGDISSGPWAGRRPPSIAGQGNGSNGGFRFTPWADRFREGPGTDDWALSDSWTPDIFEPWDSVLGIESTLGNHDGQGLQMDQALQQLGGFNQDRSERIELFRTTMVFDTPGVHEISFLPADCGFWDNPELTHVVLGLEEVLSVLSVQVATVEARIPTPATLLVLGAIPLVRRRR